MARQASGGSASGDDAGGGAGPGGGGAGGGEGGGAPPAQPPTAPDSPATPEAPAPSAPATSGPRAPRPAPPAPELPPGVTRAQMREFREAFRLFDRDGDGSITQLELGRVMRSLGQFAREEELRLMLREADADGDGNVSFEEFVSIVCNLGAAGAGAASTAEDEERELRDAFRVFDKHNRGYISASDLRAVLQCLGEDLSEEEIEDMIKEVDVDGDGRIDFYEFVNALGEPGEESDVEAEDEDGADGECSPPPSAGVPERTAVPV
ncbi:hypothetical protein R5R35_007573 [Gryllus longicercus]|uniref:EF-hand domain-containing protein n=1 Tax=Gryllus longicercus TaxID=2509291 RepID=A0AAN9W0G4_9ORTH